MLKGIGASAGIGIGRAVLIRQPDLNYAHVAFSGQKAEQERLAAAVDAVQKQTRDMAEELEVWAGSAQAEILLGQITMIEDPDMVGQMHEQIAAGHCAERAVDTVCRRYIELFSTMEDELMRQRATDVEDLRTRMLMLLLGQEARELSALPEDAILVTHELTPSMAAELKWGSIAGIAAEVGGTVSHAAILARTLEVPAVLSVSGLTEQVQDGDAIILDGGDGVVLLSPDESTVVRYRARQASFREAKAALIQFAGKPTRTEDGRSVALYGNIGNPEHAQQVMEVTGEGVGLFRTEHLFLERETQPSEEEQFAAYRKAVEIMNGREVIIRTLDIGGDKPVPYLNMVKEENPFLGLRGVRYCLEREDIFVPQLRALLRASAYGRLKIMLPMVTSLEELRRTRALLEKLKGDLDEAGIPYEREIQLGVMIETPAAVLLADLLAREADFFSIGTNDLTQYIMAADRGNRKVSALGVACQPAVLRAIQSVICAGHSAGIPVGMCGEAAAEPNMIPLLLNLGLDEFSVNPAAILQTRKSIAGWSKAETDELTQRVMACGTLEEVLACFK